MSEPLEAGFVGLRPVKAERPKVLLSIPDAGLVSTIATTHLIHELKLEEVGHFESELIPPVLMVHEGEIRHPVRAFSAKSLIVVNSEVPLPPSAIHALARGIVKWSGRLNSKLLLGATGLPAPNRMETDRPAVYAVAFGHEGKYAVKEAKLQPFNEGVIAGGYALVLKEAMRAKASCLLLLAESHLQFPDPGAAASVLEALNRILGLEVEVKCLIEQAEEIRIKARELMRRTQQQMKPLQKGLEQEIPGIYV